MALQIDEYLRQRLDPKPGDPLYLHLIDLRRSLAEFETNDPIRILDYGCGGSPYRSLFPNAMYHRADFVPVDGVDFQVDAEGALPAVPSGFYDLVLSTQVLEHVIRPQIYLQEAKRVLKPGGNLLLTTHGVFPDHACPFDFWRWTADGLELELTRAGLVVGKRYRLTAGPRAVLFWVSQFCTYHEAPASPLLRLLSRSIRKIIRWQHKRIDRFFDRSSASYGVKVERSMGQLDFSIALLAFAQKPTLMTDVE